MKLYDKVKQVLIMEPLARERKLRGRAIWFLLKQEDLRMQGEPLLTKEMFIDKWPAMQSINRLICKVQEDNIMLRGKDYGDKDRLEQERMLELGYQPGYNNDIKLHKKI